MQEDRTRSSDPCFPRFVTEHVGASRPVTPQFLQERLVAHPYGMWHD